MTKTREYWLQSMLRIANPVLETLARGELKAKMPLYHHPDAHRSETCTYLEALGRTLMGMAPWLEKPAEDAQEEILRQTYAQLARDAIRQAVDPASPDCMNFSSGMQPIVDAAFLAEAILRAKTELYAKLDDKTKGFLIERMKEIRTRKPYICNWLLFPAMIESFLHFAGEPDWDPMRVDYALHQHMQWYKGDGAYGDGPEFHFDYYNSFVIQPMLRDILDEVGEEYPDWTEMVETVQKRATHCSSVLEQSISPEGTYPVIGRSATYRFGVFHLLAQSALTDALEPTVKPAQVRCGMTAVLQRQISYPGTFDENGWLQIGVCGKQPRMGEPYISTGSLYLCLAFFLPLGLPESAPFWSDADEPWTQKRIWDSGDTMAEHYCSNKHPQV